MRAMTFALALLVALPLAPAAQAMTISNDTDEAVNVWIQNWLYRLRAGRSTEFIPTESPVEIIVELRHFRLTCTADGDSEVRIGDETCYVDGQAVGESRFQL